VKGRVIPNSSGQVVHIPLPLSGRNVEETNPAPSAPFSPGNVRDPPCVTWCSVVSGRGQCNVFHPRRGQLATLATHVAHLLSLQLCRSWPPCLRARAPDNDSRYFNDVTMNYLLTYSHVLLRLPGGGGVPLWTFP